MSSTNQLRLGLGLAVAAGLISGFSIWVNSYAAKDVADAAVFATAKNTLVGIALGIGLLLLRRKQLTSIRELHPRQRVLLVLLGVVGGSIPFVLFFEGLAQSGPGMAAFIQKSLFLWVALLAVPFLGERVGPLQVGALAMVAYAQWLIGRPAGWEFGQGEALVLAATLLWSVEAVIARRLLPSIPAAVGAFSRMAIGALILLGYLAIRGKLGALIGLDGSQAAWVLLTAGILVVYVSAWYSALKFAPATAVTALLTIGAPITAVLSTASGKPSPQPEQVAGYALVAAAAGLLVLTHWRGRARRLTASPVAVVQR